MTRIEAKYLTKVYKNGAYGLKNCSFSVNGGEFLVILGASGSGKSTLLKVLAGTEGLSSGELYFDGILSENIPVSKRGISMVFQEYVLYPHMTVFDNLATPLRQAGENEKNIYDRVMDALRIFGLEITADVKPKNLSGGEQQRVALAKALLKKSKIVLLDEPMSNVDEKSRAEYCTILKKMKQMLPDSTFIYVTHNVREALFLADRIAVMRDGAVLQLAPTELLLKYPLHTEVNEILGGIGNSPSLSMTEIRLEGRLVDNRLELSGQTIELDEEYMSRLLRHPNRVDVIIEVDRLSKVPLSDSFPLVLEVTQNNGDHLLMKTDGREFVYGKKTNLHQGEKIRLYYKIRDLIICEGEDRLTCHYPLHNRVKIRRLDSRGDRVEILGKRVKLGRELREGVNYLDVSEPSFSLSYVRSRYSLPVAGCLDEEFINGKKLSHIAIKGTDTYLSVMSSEDVSCFGKKRVWLNIYPGGILN
ncbi:MAG: ABC transporter ATP-binding protein [Clostridia bacterium]|nr:ABC transporter ATP-binding protein [Clostridia bacterium]